MQLGVITSTRVPDLLDYDKDVVRLLKNKGITAKPLIWENSNNLHDFDCFIFRTAWGYHTDIERFHLFLDKLENTGKPIWNPVSIVRKNLRKTYLKELESQGFNIFPSLFIEKNLKQEINSIIESTGWSKVVIKPVVSAGSENTYLSSDYDIHVFQSYFESLLEKDDVIIQKFFPEIYTDGEISTIYFSNGARYSVRKIPIKGDYRVQNQYGGNYSLIKPSQKLLEISDEVASIFLDECLYVRVDGVESNGDFFIMEVEMIEPDLYMNIVPEAKEQFADSVLKKIDFANLINH